MTPTETQTLKIIWGNKGKTSLFKIARELKFSTDYCRVICGSLMRNRILEFGEGQYGITNKGRRELEKFGIIEKVPEEKVAEPQDLEVREATITELSNLRPELVRSLEEKGFRSLEDVATASLPRLLQEIEGLKLTQAARIINEARDKLRREGKEYLWGEEESDSSGE